MVVSHMCLAQAGQCNHAEEPPAKRSCSSITIGTTTKVTVDIHKTDEAIKNNFWKQLKQAAPAAIATDRKIQKKKPPKGKAGSARVTRVGKRSADVAAGALKKRLHEFAGHTLFMLS